MRQIKSAENDITVSVILPVFNVSPWISRCIESLKAQQQEGLEFIFIDDCSTDDSLEKIKSFADEDSRVRILNNNKNIGSGPSRNRGIDSARGEYLSFVDPDDWISQNFYTVLNEKAKETGSNIIKGNREHVNKEGILLQTKDKNSVNRRIEQGTKEEIPLYCLFTTEHHSAIYKSAFIKRDSIRYGNARKSQDTTFLLRLCKKTEDIQICDEAVYYYFSERAGSAINSFPIERAYGDLIGLTERLDILLKDPLDNYSFSYIQRDISMRISSLFYVSATTHNEKITDNLQSQLCAQILRIQDQAALRKNLPEINALVQHGFLIPAQKTILSDPLFSDRVIRWVDFIHTYPDANQPYAIYGCSSAFVHSAYLYCKSLLFHEFTNSPDLIKSRNIIKKQWSRLDKRTRHQIIMRMPKAGLDRLLRKIDPYHFT